MKKVIALGGTFVVLVLFIAWSAKAGQPQTQGAALVKVESKKVCMLNDKAFDKDQIPVVVGGRTYYGCCEMCKKALTEKAELRTAVDPVSGKKVDKSTAVIGAKPDGTTLYFENDENLKTFQKRQQLNHE
jgi:YHS domain-containing protein